MSTLENTDHEITANIGTSLPTPGEVLGGKVGERLQTSPPAFPNWIEENQAMAVTFAFILVFFYTMPVFIITCALLTTRIFQESNLLLSWFFAFMKSADSTLGGFHKVLFPVMSGLSVIVFQGKPTKAMLFLGLFILFLFALTVAIGVVFDIPTIQKSLSLLENPINPEVTRAFFTRIQETLLMYLMMLIGISVANSSK